MKRQEAAADARFWQTAAATQIARRSRLDAAAVAAQDSDEEWGGQFFDDPTVHVPDYLTTMPDENCFAALNAHYRNSLLSTINMKLSIK